MALLSVAHEPESMHRYIAFPSCNLISLSAEDFGENAHCMIILYKSNLST